MANKLLITQALDERALLVKKINDKIESAQFVDIKKSNEENVAVSLIPEETFRQKAESSYQQIMDLIDRYQKIDAAIIYSNAVTTIETSYGSFTVAAVIALKNRLKAAEKNDLYKRDPENAFEKLLEKKLNQELSRHISMKDTKNKSLSETAENMRLSILGKESRNKEDNSLEVVAEYVKQNTYELIDPLNASEKIEALRMESVTLLSELETAIKVSNATTFIEI